MADRTVSVKLIADAREYIAGMDKAVQKTKDSTQSVEQQLAAQERAFTQVGVAATAVGVLALAGGAALLAVPKIADFRVALSTLNITAATTATTPSRYMVSCSTRMLPYRYGPKAARAMTPTSHWDFRELCASPSGGGGFLSPVRRNESSLVLMDPPDKCD